MGTKRISEMRKQVCIQAGPFTIKLTHIINDQWVHFCLNCDDWVKDKSKVLDENWTLFDNEGNLRYDV